MGNYKLKLGNMRKEQEFALYPYDGGDSILLQSDKRFAKINLHTGEGFINGKNKNYSTSISLLLNPVACKLPDDIKTEIQARLWHNNGKDGNIQGIVTFRNEKLFSK